jgi:hypothetical protein
MATVNIYDNAAPGAGMARRTGGKGKEKGRAMTRKELTLLLAEKELSLRQWALEHGYNPRTVAQVVSRYTNTDRQPRGRMTHRILRELSQALGKEILPGILEDENR